jgi:hypothetical protein
MAAGRDASDPATGAGAPSRASGGACGRGERQEGASTWAVRISVRTATRSVCPPQGTHVWLSAERKCKEAARARSGRTHRPARLSSSLCFASAETPCAQQHITSTAAQHTACTAAPDQAANTRAWGLFKRKRRKRGASNESRSRVTRASVDVLSRCQLDPCSIGARPSESNPASSNSPGTFARQFEFRPFVPNAPPPAG